MPPSHTDAIPLNSPSYHTTCPPEGFRHNVWQSEHHDASPELRQSVNAPTESMRDAPVANGTSPVIDTLATSEMSSKFAELDVDAVREPAAPVLAATDFSGRPDLASLSDFQLPEQTPALGSSYSLARLLPSYSSSFLRPGSSFRGEQISESKRFEVEVEVKHVDMKNSFLCGYLTIKGLTTESDILTTYFEGEIIGPKYGFLARRPEWSVNERRDIENWQSFPATRPIERQVRKPSFSLKNFTQREHIFMRWKEQFVVPDPENKSSGASLEGFYYICMNQVTGGLTGIYYSTKITNVEKLELTHVEDFGRSPAMEFR